MIKKSLMYLFFLILIVGCSNQQAPVDITNQVSTDQISQNSQIDRDSVKAYFPIVNNTAYVYVDNEDNEVKTVFNMYTTGDKVQQNVKTKNFEIDNIIQVNKNSVVINKSILNNVFIENYIDTKPDLEEIILKTPIELGNNWTNNRNIKSQITSVEAEVKTDSNTYSTIEVTTDLGDNSYEKYYFAKGVGIVKYVKYEDDIDQVVNILSAIKTNYNKTLDMKLSYPDFYSVSYNDFEFVDVQTIFTTNSNNMLVFETLLKTNTSDDFSILPKGTKINFMRYDMETKTVYLDLSKEYIDDMKFGSGFESMARTSLANTLCSYANAEKLKLTIGGKNYESGHIQDEDDFYIFPVGL